MKKIFLLTTFTLVLMSCNDIDKIAPKGPVTKEYKTLESFNEVSVASGIGLIVKNGTQEVYIETNKNIQDYIQTSVKNGRLIIKTQTRISFYPPSKITAYVSAELIQAISASGGSSVQIEETLTADKLSLDGSGGASFKGNASCNDLDIELSGGGKTSMYITCNQLKVDASGGSVLDLSGSVANTDLEMSGGGHFKGFNLLMSTLHADLSGGGTADVNVSDNISGDLSGGSKITYIGNPVINVKSSGGSKVRPK